MAHVKKFHRCLVHGNLKHMPHMPLHCMTLPLFFTWGININDKIHLQALNGHEYVLVTLTILLSGLKLVLSKS